MANWERLEHEQASWLAHTLPQMSLDDARFELSRLQRSSSKLTKIKKDFTRPIPPGGWNTERVFVELTVRHVTRRILALRQHIEIAAAAEPTAAV